MTKNVARRHRNRNSGKSSPSNWTPGASCPEATLLDDSVSREVLSEPPFQEVESPTVPEQVISSPIQTRSRILNETDASPEPVRTDQTLVAENQFDSFSSPPARWRSSQIDALVSPRTQYDPTRDAWGNPPKTYPSTSTIPYSNHTSPIGPATNRSNQSTALSGVPDSNNDHAYLGPQEACLMRHFVECLGPWFDCCDRDRHYTVVVPQRAMFCPVLLYAVYTAAARHLTRLASCRNSQKVIVCHGISLPDLTDDTAIHYSNMCIQFLMDISNDPAQNYNEDALTAATILTFFERIDAPLAESETQVYLSVIRAVIDTQKDPSFYAIWKIQGPIRDSDLYLSPACSLRHQACILALQQEITSILLSQQPCRLPLCPNNDYSPASLSPTNDFVWANRILVWTADVLKFCFGDENSNTVNISVKTRVEHWEALKQFEQSWTMLQPASYKAIYYEPADSANGKVFPAIWHISDCHTVALQHLELGKILLTVHNPKTPRLGLGAESAQRIIRYQARDACIRICGLGLSRKNCAPSMVAAAVGASICGECLTDRQEQLAVLKLMDEVEFEHGWPTKMLADALKVAWADE